MPDPGLFYSKAVVGAEETVMRGFTTVRDVAWCVFGIKAIDTGIINGPKIFPTLVASHLPFVFEFQSKL